jgi:hypothetical protein
MEAICPSETPVDFKRTTRRFNPNYFVLKFSWAPKSQSEGTKLSAVMTDDHREDDIRKENVYKPGV